MTSATFDTRRPIMVNSAAYQRQLKRKSEPHTSLAQAMIAAFVLAAFVTFVLFSAVSLSKWPH